jgi:hypothetical protein
MKQYALFAMLSLYSGCIMYGADIPGYPGIVTKDSDRKIQNSSEKDKLAAKIFWDNVYVYSRFCNQTGPDRERVITTLKWVLETNPAVLLMKKDRLEFNQYHAEYDGYVVKTLSNVFPLDIIARLAVGRDFSDPEWPFFKDIARQDTNNSNRLPALGCGIDYHSTAIVKEMLTVGTDITQAPQIIQRLVNCCRSQNLSKSYTSLTKKCRFLEITSLLLSASVDLSTMPHELENHAHVKDESCLICPLIMHSVNQKKLQHSGTTHPQERMMPSSETEKECDQKKDHNDLNIKLFWDYVNTYHVQANKYSPNKKAIETTLNTLYSFLKSNPYIFSSCSTDSTLHKRYGVQSCSPLTLAALMAVGRSRQDAERIFFNNIAPLAPYNNQQIEALLIGIQRLSFPLVLQMIRAGTNVTHAPQVMSALITRCEALSKSIDDLHKNLYEILKAQHDVLGITNILLGAHADLSGLTEHMKRPHVKDGKCFSCNLIKERALSLPLPSAPSVSLYPELRSSASSSSSSLSSSSSSSMNA